MRGQVILSDRFPGISVGVANYTCITALYVSAKVLFDVVMLKSQREVVALYTTGTKKGNGVPVGVAVLF